MNHPTGRPSPGAASSVSPVTSVLSLLPYAFALEAVTALAFELIYAGANALTAWHSWRVPLAFPWEMQIPLVPAAVLLYWSLWPLVLLAPFVLRTKARMNRLAWVILVETAVAALFFILCPAEVAYPHAPDLGLWNGLYTATTGISMKHNLFPSLHVAFACTCALFYSRAGGNMRTLGFAIWASLIAASTLLLHLHHAVDLVGGAALAWICSTYVRVPEGWSKRVNRLGESSRLQPESEGRTL